MRNRTLFHLDDAIEAVIDARNHAPLPHIQRDILCKLTRRLHEEGLFNRQPTEALAKHDRPMSRIL